VESDAGAGFEGVVRVLVDTKKREFANVAVRGARASFPASGEVGGALAVVIADTARGRALYVRKEQRTFTISPDTEPPPGWELTQTGKRETIAGRRCEVWVLAHETRKATACVTNELPPIDVGRISFAAAPAEWTRVLVANKVFPLRAEEPGVFAFHVSTVVAAPQNPDDFAVPDGFTELKLQKPVLPK
jgi:hypothetical protein